jgi:hypothetical protein
MFATLTTLLLAVGPPGPASEPVLLAKGAGYYVHAIPDVLAPLSGFAGALGGQRFGKGLGLYHTAAGSGKMQFLIGGGTSAVIIPMGIDRIQYTDRRIAGVVADPDQLYVLVCDRWNQIERRDPIPPPKEFTGRGWYTLVVFNLADGKLLHELELKEGDFPREPSATDTAKPGPLVLKPNGVAVFGVTFTFKGPELVEQRYEKKPGQ